MGGECGVEGGSKIRATEYQQSDSCYRMPTFAVLRLINAINRREYYQLTEKYDWWQIDAINQPINETELSDKC